MTLFEARGDALVVYPQAPVVDPRLVMVVIGRNEGSRLSEVLASALAAHPAAAVYVDSGSNDGSCDRARQQGGGLVVQALGDERPHTAARGRNEGVRLALEAAPQAEYVQFLDGDCVLEAGWTAQAMAHLDAHPDVGVVAGRLREQDREKNWFHRLADLEWDVPAGEVESTGGICMMRISAFAEAGGFHEAIGAGEELHLAKRIRAAGFRIVILADDMARHDIKMEHFAQWWKRARRYGHATAESVYRYGLSDTRRRQELRSILTWGAAVPLAATGLALPTLGGSLGLFLGYPLLFARVRRYRLGRGDRADDAALYAAATLVAKFAAAWGTTDFARRWVSGQIRR